MAILPHGVPFEAGDGPTGVLVLHGFTGSPAAVKPWAEELAAAGHTVSVPRLPGHGTTWQEMAVTSWQDWYDHVDAAYTDLRARCDRVFVGGLSMGGTLALRLAEQHTDVAGLLLVNAALGSVNPVARFAGLVKHLVRTTPAIGGDIALEGADEGAYDTVPTASVEQLMKLFTDVRTCLDLVTCPILLMRSDVDHVVPASSADAIRRLTSSPDITDLALTRSYHVATLDHDADLIAAESLAFIDRVVG